jgi:hypothetical protein
MNIECRIMNFEVRNFVDFSFLMKTERSDSTLRHSSVRYSAVLRFAFQPFV